MHRVAVGLALVWGLITSGAAWGQFGGDDPPPPAALVCEVDGPVAIVKLLPDGKTVKKGDEVCELDSADLKDRLTNALVAIRRADAVAEREKLLLQVAELADGAYERAEYPLEQARLEARIKLAQGELVLAKRELEALQGAPGGESPGLLRAKLEFSRCEFALREAQTSLEILRGYTYPRRHKELKAAIEGARAAVLAAGSSLAMEKARAERIGKQIEACVIKAPRGGVFRPGPSLNIQEGGTVQARQVLGWIIVPPEGEPRGAKPGSPNPTP
jgi:HlyD family secretion protein